VFFVCRAKIVRDLMIGKPAAIIVESDLVNIVLSLSDTQRKIERFKFILENHLLKLLDVARPF